MKVHTENAKRLKIVDVTLKVPYVIDSHTCDQPGAQFKCEKLKSMPIEIMYNGHKIVGDLFIHIDEFRRYVNYTQILVLYNVKQFKMICKGFEWQVKEKLAQCQLIREYVDLPKTDLLNIIY